MDQKYSADPGLHADLNAMHASLLSNCVDSFVRFRSGNFAYKSKAIYIIFMHTMRANFATNENKHVIVLVSSLPKL